MSSPTRPAPRGSRTWPMRIAGKLSDPVFQAFAERAIRAVEDVRCATLPLPKQMLGKVNKLTFRFSP